MNIIPVILSGGSGSRLWPISRALYPKQLLPLTSDKTMIQETILRLPQNLQQNSIIICNEEHRFLIASQMQQINIKPSILLEPIGRNTAPAIAAAAFSACQKHHDAILVILPADHHIQKQQEYEKALYQAIKLAEKDYIVTFGIIPSHAETGYGYIQAGNNIEESTYAIKRFIEKPNLATAQEFFTSGEYAWNSGMFCCKASIYLEELQKYYADIYNHVQQSYLKSTHDLDFIRLDKGSFEQANNISIDYAIMEKTDKGVLIQVDLGWNDVGSWSSLHDISLKDENGNVVNGDITSINSKNNYLRTDGAMLAVSDIDNMIVIATKDAVLVAPLEHAQKVKNLVDIMKSEGKDQHYSHTKVYRPWGWYETIELGTRFQVKHLMVNPGATLSLQMHHHRAEHWVIVHGTALVQKNEEEILLSENESTYIPIGVTHRLTNPGKIPLSVIEVQSGTYLGEDDIVRFEDIYKRV